MNLKDYQTLNVARKKLALRDAGYTSSDPFDILEDLARRNFEFSLQHLADRWGVVWFGQKKNANFQHLPLFDNATDAVYYAALCAVEKGN